MADTKMGVFVGNDPAALKPFEDFIGHPVDMVLAYTSGASPGDWDGPNPSWQLSDGFLGGTDRPLFFNIPMAPDDAGVGQYREIAAGLHNDTYQEWAQEILGSRQGDSEPIYIRTTWEVGGEWFPWTAVAQQDPEAFKGAWQQFAQAFHDVSDRFQMVWDFTGDRGPVEQWYPGDEAVDVISQDIYWNPQYSGPDPVAGFEWNKDRERGLDWMSDFAAQHHKPMAISEWGAHGDDAGPWLDAFRDWVQHHDVAYTIYWNGGEGSGYDGEVTSGRWPDAADNLREVFDMAATDTPTTPGTDPDVTSVPGNGTPPPPVSGGDTDTGATDDGGTDAPPGPGPVVDGGDGDTGDTDDAGGDTPPVTTAGWPEPDPDPNPDYTYPAQTDWAGIGDLVGRFHEANGFWLAPDDIVNLEWQPDPEGGEPAGGGDQGGGGDDQDGGFTYPALNDWGAWGAITQQFHDAKGYWADQQTIMDLHFEPEADEGDDPGDGGDGGDAVIDWNAAAAAVNAYHELTGLWVPYGQIPTEDLHASTNSDMILA